MKETIRDSIEYTTRTELVEEKVSETTVNEAGHTIVNTYVVTLSLIHI